LKHRLKFESRRTADDGAGNREGDWVTRFACRAKIQPKGGGEEVTAARLSGIQPVIITVRQNVNTRQVTTAWRAVDLMDGTHYNIRTSADFQQRRAYLDMMAETGGADG
jgi:SPP1 family predicted phage head-tail adaptor